MPKSPKVPSTYEPCRGDIVRCLRVRQGETKSIAAWAPTWQEMVHCEKSITVQRDTDLTIVGKPGYKCSYDWVVDLGEDREVRWGLVRDAQVRVVDYGYNRLMGRLVRTKRDVIAFPCEDVIMGGRRYIKTNEILLCVGYQGTHESLAMLIKDGECLVAAKDAFERMLDEPA